MKIKKWILPVTCFFCFILTSCNKASKDPLTYNGFAFNTIIGIQIYDTDNKDILNQCGKLCQEYEEKFSRTLEGSEIYELNHSNGAPVTVSDDTIQLIQKGLYYSELSNGVFDITMGSVTNLWDFTSEEHVVPTKEALENAVSHVDYRNVIIEGNQVTLTDPEAVIDLGGIAKGYVADQLKQYLIDQNVTHALINLGGNVIAIGGKPDGSPYHIGVPNPKNKDHDYIASFDTKEDSIVTSGTYQRSFKKDGVLYHHILDSSTGYPCKNDLSSVTIIAPSSVDADALSTTCFLLGKEKGLELINSLESTEALFIDNTQHLFYSKNAKRK